MAAPSDAVELTAVLWAAPEGGFSALNPGTVGGIHRQAGVGVEVFIAALDG